MLVLLNTFTILGSSNLPISKHCWAPRHHSTCTFAFSAKDLHPSAFSCLKKQESARRIRWKRICHGCVFLVGIYISQNYPFSIVFTRWKKPQRSPTVVVGFFFVLWLFNGGALSTNACRSFHFASSGMFPIQSFLAGSSVLPRLSGWSSVGTQIRRANGTEIKATFSCGLRFPLPLPLPLKANLSPGVVEAPVKHPAKHLPRAPKHWRHHHAIIVGHHALHNQRKPGILDKRSFPHPIIIHHRISNHWKKQ